MAPDGGILVVGGTHGDLDGHTNAGGSDIFIMKLDASGSPGSTDFRPGPKASENFTGAWSWTVQRGTSMHDNPAAMQAPGRGGVQGQLGIDVPATAQRVHMLQSVSDFQTLFCLLVLFINSVLIAAALPPEPWLAYCFDTRSRQIENGGTALLLPASLHQFGSAAAVLELWPR